jgi:tetratricopeptide (TPR) repeat protein
MRGKYGRLALLPGTGSVPDFLKLKPAMTNDFKQWLFAAQAKYYSNDPHDIEIVREICEALIALKREDELLLWADRALALSPNAPDFVEMRAYSLNLLGRHAEAADAWARDPSLSGDPALYRVRLGYSLMMAGDLARAIPLLDEARWIAASSNVPILAMAEHLLGEANAQGRRPARLHALADAE